jgi:hypothetical protein
MNRGGKRAGAGRKPGSLTKKTREIAERAAADGITPLCRAGQSLETAAFAAVRALESLPRCFRRGLPCFPALLSAAILPAAASRTNMAMTEK